MKVIGIASAKGGCSKSTLCMHLGVESMREGAKTVLLDMDPQQSLKAWHNEREAGSEPSFAEASITRLNAVLGGLRKQGVDYVMLDTPPQTTAAIGTIIEECDLILIPVRPSPVDLRAVGRTIDIAKSRGIPYLFVVTQATRGATLTTQAMAVLSAYGAVAGVMHMRVNYAGVTTAGSTLTEYDPQGAGAMEIAAIWASVLARLTDGDISARNHVRKDRKVAVHA